MELKIMPEYGSLPVWIKHDEDSFFDNAILEEIDLFDDEFISEIELWNEEFQNTFDDGNPLESGFQDDENEHAFIDKGITITLKLEKKIGSKVEFIFFGEKISTKRT